MKERIAKFMAGRYGNDQLGRALLILDVILLLLASIFSKPSAGCLRRWRLLCLFLSTTVCCPRTYTSGRRKTGSICA